MPVELRFDFYGDTQLQRTLQRFQTAARDASPAFQSMGDSFAKAERRQFATEGVYASGGWAPLSEPYRTWKAEHYPGAKILHLTGDLERSLTVRPFDVDVVESQFAVFGSSVQYGEFHQAGGGRLPRRRPVELPETLRRRWVQILQRWIVQGDLLSFRGNAGDL